jgi:hypothetical protein
MMMTAATMMTMTMTMTKIEAFLTVVHMHTYDFNGKCPPAIKNRRHMSILLSRQNDATGANMATDATGRARRPTAAAHQMLYKRAERDARQALRLRITEYY